MKTVRFNFNPPHGITLEVPEDCQHLRIAIDQPNGDNITIEYDLIDAELLFGLDDEDAEDTTAPGAPIIQPGGPQAVN